MFDQRVEVVLGIAAWYVTSFGTLILNKYLLGELHIQPNTLACVQMVSTAIYGGLKNINFGLLLRSGLREVWPYVRGGSEKGNRVDIEDAGDFEDPKSAAEKFKSTWRRGLLQMGLVGAMRFSTVVLGLVSLKFVAASFTETVKASAPLFTVVIAFFMLGERTPTKVVAALIPVALGLAMVSLTEISFNAIGFGAAVSTNIIECVQNVFSKRLLAREYTASQLQFYTSLTALMLQLPIFMASMQFSGVAPPLVSLDANATAALDGAESRSATAHISFELSPWSVSLLWIDGVIYHLQSVVAYVVMSYLSPVTVSVVNTLKRALIIWISVLIFGNHVTSTAALGTLICLLGAFWYNYARQEHSREENQRQHKR